MVKVKRDIHARQRQLDLIYRLNTTKGVKKLLNSVPELKESRYWGDYASCDLLIDLETALERLELSETQKRIIELHFYLGLTQVEVAEVLGMTQQGVAYHIATILKRLRNIFSENEDTN